jgi:hypothetical protein
MLVDMSTHPSSLTTPAWFSEAARTIVEARRPLWQYELLGQVLCDAVDQAGTMAVPDSAVSVPASVSFPGFGSYCLELVERLANNLESMNPVIAEEVEQIAHGGMHAFGNIAAKMAEAFLVGRQLEREVNGLSVRCAELTPHTAWRRELEGYMAKVKNDLCEMASRALLIHQSIGESILARVRQTQHKVEAGSEDGCILDLNLRFSFETDTFNDHLQLFINCIDTMNRVVDARILIARSPVQYGLARPGKIFLYQDLFDADVVSVGSRYDDGQDTASASSSSSLPSVSLRLPTSPAKSMPSYVCIREVHVADLSRAEACVHALLDAYRTATFPVTYQLPATEASELILRVSQLYSLPSMP